MLQGWREERKRRESEAAIRRLIKKKKIAGRAGEPLAPWIRFPGFLFFDGLERFGARGPGNEYEEWKSYWSGLTINQRHEYFRHYDLGDEWPERDQWYELWVVREDFEDPGTYLRKLVEESNLDSHPDEPAPPWVRFPELDDPTADWNSGEGREYLNRIFFPFFTTLTESEKQDFLSRHDLGLGWTDRDEWMILVGWTATPQ